MADLLSLPLEVFRCVFDEITTTVGLYESFRLRLVCRLFNSEVVRCVFQPKPGKVYADEQCYISFYEHKRINKMPEALRTEFLYQNLHSMNKTKFLIFWIIEAAGRSFVEREPTRYQTPQQLLELHRLLCSAVVAYFGRATFAVLHTWEFTHRTIRNSPTEKSVSDDFEALSLYINDYSIKEGSQFPTKEMFCHLASAAAFLGNLEVLKEMLDRGADINGESDYFGRPLQNAAKNGHNDIVRYLLEHGARINDKTLIERYGYTASRLHRWTVYVDQFMRASALDVASRCGQEQTVELLLQPKYEIRREKHMLGMEPYDIAIGDAVRIGNLPITQLLLDHPDFDMLRYERDLVSRLLIFGAIHGKINIVTEMINRGANLCHNWSPPDGKWALHYAAENGHPEIVDILLKLTYEPESEDRKGHDALSYACMEGHTTVVDVCLAHGFNVNRIYSNLDLTQFDPRPHRIPSQIQSPPMAGLYSRPLREYPSSDATPLYIAAAKRRLLMMRHLLDSGADLLTRDCGAASLEEAVRKGHIEVVEFLLQAGVHPDGRPGCVEDSPMSFALRNDLMDIVDILLKFGAKKVDPL